jgi:hypothetical protein
MIETSKGIKIEFEKLDEWAIKMIIKIPSTKGDKVVASPIFTIDQLKNEIQLLEKK